MSTTAAGDALRRARRLAGLSQSELAARAGVAQSVISVYEAGRRQPSVPMLQTLVAAAGYELELRVNRSRRGLARLAGPLGGRVRRCRRDVLRIAARYDVRVIGVFGSVARGEEGEGSDVDLLVKLPPTMGLLALGRLNQELEDLLGTTVELVPEGDLKPGVRPAVEADLVRL